MNVKRRDLLRMASVITAVAVMPRALARSGDPDTRKLLVLVELKGGNDGLNTLIPYSDQNYYQWRPTIGVKDTEVANTKISNDLALHPSMGKLKTLYDAGKVAVIAGVGYPNPNLSHFTSASKTAWQRGYRLSTARHQ